MVYAKVCTRCHKPTRYEETSEMTVYARCENCGATHKHIVLKFDNWNRYYAYMLTQYNEAESAVYQVGDESTLLLFGDKELLWEFADRHSDKKIGAYHARLGCKKDKQLT